MRFLIGAGVCLIFSCNTYVWQPVDQLIQGTWIASPNPKPDTDGQMVTEKWTFDQGCLDVAIWDQQGRLKRKEQYINCLDTGNAAATCVSYQVENRADKDYIHADNYFCGTDPQITGNDPGKWIVVKVSKDELFLSAEVEKNGRTIKGSRQIGFVAE